MQNTADMVLTIDAHDVVADVSVTHGSDQVLAELWTGQSVASIVSPESLGKLARLLKTDAGEIDSEGVWQHVNLVRSADKTVPLLMIFARLPAQSGLSGLIIARDLRPTVELSERFRRATREMERRYEELAEHDEAVRHQPARFDDAEFGKQAAGRIGSSLLINVMERVHESPMDDIIDETVRIIERLCISEALKHTHGGEDEAAQILGISVDDLRRKLFH